MQTKRKCRKYMYNNNLCMACEAKTEEKIYTLTCPTYISMQIIRDKKRMRVKKILIAYTTKNILAASTYLHVCEVREKKQNQRRREFAIRNDIRMRTVEKHSAAFAESVSGNGIANTNATRFECRLLFFAANDGLRSRPLCFAELLLPANFNYDIATHSLLFNSIGSNRLEWIRENECAYV